MLILKIDWGQLTEYPFNSSVWGTASDVAMVIVTGITAWFLIKTFREQQKVSRIEEFRHSESIKPEFTLRSNKVELRLYREVVCANFIINFVLNENSAKNITVEISNLQEVIHRETRAIAYAKQHFILVLDTVKASMYARNAGVKDYLFMLTAVVKFTDVDDTRYSQEFIIVDGDEETNKTFNSQVISDTPSI